MGAPSIRKLIFTFFVLTLILAGTVWGVIYLKPIPSKSRFLVTRDRLASKIQALIRSSSAMKINAELENPSAKWNIELKDCLTGGGLYCVNGKPSPLILIDQDGETVVAASKIKSISPSASENFWQYYTIDGKLCREPYAECPLAAQTFFIPNCMGPAGSNCPKEKVEIEVYFTIQKNPEFKLALGYPYSNDPALEFNGSTAFWVTGSTWVPLMMARIPGYYGSK